MQHPLLLSLALALAVALVLPLLLPFVDAAFFADAALLPLTQRQLVGLVGLVTLMYSHVVRIVLTSESAPCTVLGFAVLLACNVGEAMACAVGVSLLLNQSQLPSLQSKVAAMPHAGTLLPAAIVTCCLDGKVVCAHRAGGPQRVPPLRIRRARRLCAEHAHGIHEPDQRVCGVRVQPLLTMSQKLDKYSEGRSAAAESQWPVPRKPRGPPRRARPQRRP
jgi:hypothetical protein